MLACRASGRQKRLPGVVAWIFESDSDPRIGGWPYGDREQFHPGLNRCSATFATIASRTGANHIFPSRTSSLRTRAYVIEAQLAHGSCLPTVLAPVSVPCKEGLAIESYGGFGDAIVEDKPHDARDLEFTRRGLDVIFPWLFFERLQFREFGPIFEIVVRVLIVFDRDDFRAAPVKQCHRPAHIDHANGHVEAIKNKYAAIQ